MQIWVIKDDWDRVVTAFTEQKDANQYKKANSVNFSLSVDDLEVHERFQPSMITKENKKKKKGR